MTQEKSIKGRTHKIVLPEFLIGEQQEKISKTVSDIVKLLSEHEAKYQRIILDAAREKAHISDFVEKFNNDEVGVVNAKELDNLFWALKQLSWKLGLNKRFEALTHYPEMTEAVHNVTRQLLVENEEALKNLRVQS